LLKDEAAMTEEQTIGRGEILALTTEIVSAHVANNNVVNSEVPELIQQVYNKLASWPAARTCPRSS
jgi:predicted transcriptional regulator